MIYKVYIHGGLWITVDKQDFCYRIATEYGMGDATLALITPDSGAFVIKKKHRMYWHKFVWHKRGFRP